MLASLKKINNLSRVGRLIESAIEDLALDLSGINVLTEAASGAFVVTSLIAAAAGADRVFAVTRDSEYGMSRDVKRYTETCARLLGINHVIEVSNHTPKEYAGQAHLITNLGFVRPIDEAFISLLPKDAAISLMWEPWEFRETDLDLKACRKNSIPILGTCETIPRLRIFRYVGMAVLKLLLELEIEIFCSKILVIGSGHFGNEIEIVLKKMNATVMRLNPLDAWEPEDAAIYSFMETADAVVVAEYSSSLCLLGGTGIPLEMLSAQDLPVVHLCGRVDDTEMKKRNIRKHPDKVVSPGFMSVTTDYVGPKPVIDLHTAGLKVGEAMVRGMRLFGSAPEAMEYAMGNSPAMNFDSVDNG